MLARIAALAEARERLRPIPWQDPEIIRQLGVLLEQALQRLHAPANTMAEVMLALPASQKLITVEIRPQNSYAFHRSLREGEGLTGKAFTSRQPVIWQREDSSALAIPHLLATRSAIVIPLVGEGDVIGVLNFESPDQNTLTHEQLATLQGSGLIQQIEAALVPFHTTTVTQEELIQEQLDHLRNGILAGLGAKNPEDMYYQILQVAAQVVQAPEVSGGLILVRDASQNLPRSKGGAKDLYAVRAARFGAFNSAREWKLEDRSIARRVIETLSSARVDDVRLDKDYRDSGTGAAESSELIVPLVNEGVGIGVIGLVSPRLAAFSERDQTNLEKVAEIAVFAIRRAEEIRQAQRHSDQLLEASRLLALIEPLYPREEWGSGAGSHAAISVPSVERVREQVLDRILALATTYTKSEHAAIVLPRQTVGRGAYLSPVRRTQTQLVPSADEWWPTNDGITGECFTDGRLINLPDTEAAEGGVQYVSYFHGARSELAAPLKVGKTVLGVLDIDSNAPYHYTSDYEEWGRFLADQAAYALTVMENATRKRFEIGLEVLTRTVDNGITRMRALGVDAPDDQKWTEVRLHRDQLILHVLSEMARLTGAKVARLITGVNAYRENETIDTDSGLLYYLSSTDPREIETEDRYFKIGEGVTSEAFTSQHELIYNDRDSRPKGYFDSDPTRDCQSGIFVPVVEGTRSVGVLDIESLVEGTFSPDAAQAVREASELISKLLVAARLRLNELLNETLRQFERKILLSESADLEQFMRQVLDYAAHVSDFSTGWGAVIQLSPERRGSNSFVEGTFIAEYRANEETIYVPDPLDEQDIPAQGVFMRTINERKPVLVLDTRAPSAGPLGTLPWSNAPVRSMICVPLLRPVGDENGTEVEVAGLLALASPRPSEFSEADKRVLSLYAETIVTGLKNVAALNARRDLLAEISHDSLTVLGLLGPDLKGVIQDVERATGARTLDEAHVALNALQERLTTIQRFGNLLTGILIGFFDYSNNDLDPGLDTTRAPADINEIIRPQVDLIAALASENNRRVIWKFSETPILVEGSVVRNRLIRAVLFKFLENATKYAAPETDVVVHVGKSASYAYVAVESAGTIVPENEREAIWRLDYRGSNVDPGSRGSGVGLFQARTIMRRLGGYERYRAIGSETNEFSLELPLID
jgi:putative methionine-R-sulfoxide reductase with GAF domain